MNCGVLPINKPKGFTSFDIVAKVRKSLSIKKVGHTGTLDPLATGVLVVLLGNATKFQPFMMNHEKRYIASLKFGITSDTQDITGKILTQKSDFDVDARELSKVVNMFKGKIFQIPPMFSALKHNGERLYKLARKGISIERKPRETTINEIKILNFDSSAKTCKIEVTCKKGTYIRTLCNDIGEKLGCGAVMTELMRTECDGFKTSECSDVNHISLESVLPTDVMFKNYKIMDITENQFKKFKNGSKFSLSDDQRISERFSNSEVLRLYFNEQFVGLGKIDSFEVKFLKML